MVTTSSFPNLATPAPEETGIKKDSLIKEDLEGEVKKNITSHLPNVNGGSCQSIEI